MGCWIGGVQNTRRTHYLDKGRPERQEGVPLPRLRSHTTTEMTGFAAAPASFRNCSHEPPHAPSLHQQRLSLTPMATHLRRGLLVRAYSISNYSYLLNSAEGRGRVEVGLNTALA